MVVEAVAAVVLALCVLSGVHRGARASAGRVARLVAAYALALLATLHGAGLVHLALGVGPLFAPPLAGAIAFVLVWIAGGLVLHGAARRDRERVARAGGRSLGDRLGGGFVGALQGAVLVVVVGWLGGAFVGSVRLAARSDGSQLTGDPAPSPIVETSQIVVERTIEGLAGGDAIGRVTSRWLARPAEGVETLQAVLANPRIGALQRDGDLWRALDEGDLAGALDRGSLRALAADAPLRRELARLGVVPEVAVDDPAAFDAALRETVERVAPIVRGLSNDPDLQALLADPTVQSALAEGQPWRLLAHPRVRQLASRLAAQG